MLIVHHLADSQSERIVWLCEELGLDYELRRYERRPDRLAPDAYRALHPMGIAPVVEDGDRVLGESGAICDYVDATYGGGRLAPGPADAGFAKHLFWFHWANGTFMAALIAQLAVRMATDGGATAPFVEARLARCWAMIEDRLGQAPFFGGEALTTADIMMVYNLTTARTFRGTTITDRPNLLAYLARIGARPAYRRAMARCEPGRAPMLS